MIGFMNVHGITIYHHFMPIENSLINTTHVYFVPNELADPFYKNKRNVGVVEQLPFLECDGYLPALELDIITRSIPDLKDDQFICGKDMTKFDMIIVQDNRIIVYDVLTKYDVNIHESFFKPAYFQAVMPRFKELPIIILN